MAMLMIRFFVIVVITMTKTDDGDDVDDDDYAGAYYCLVMQTFPDPKFYNNIGDETAYISTLQYVNSPFTIFNETNKENFSV